MDFLKVSRGLLLAIILGLAFSAWIRPATTGGLLLLVTVSSIIFYLVLFLLYVIWSRLFRRLSRPPSEPAAGPSPGFISQRNRPASGGDAEDRSE